MEIIFGRNKKEQLEPLRATVTGETSVFRWASFSFPVLEVVYGSLDPIYGNKMRQDPETVSVNKWGMFAHGNSVSKGRAITSHCLQKSVGNAPIESHVASGETRG